MKKKVRLQFSVYPDGLKVRYYDDLNNIRADFLYPDELKDANIFVLLNGVVAGEISTIKLIEELF